MIKIVNLDLFDSLPPRSVILHQVECSGAAKSSTADQIRERFPDWYPAFSGFCGMFQGNGCRSEKELLGSFHKFNASEDVVICSAFAQPGTDKARQQTDYGAWEKALGRVERQLRRMNAAGDNWTLHVRHGLGCGLGGGDWDKMSELFEYFFGNSPVELFVHQPEIRRDQTERC